MLTISKRSLCERMQVCIRCLLDRYHRVISIAERTDDFIQFALNCDDLTRLSVLNHEHHHEVAQRAHAVENRGLPFWKFTGDADHYPIAAINAAVLPARTWAPVAPSRWRARLLRRNSLHPSECANAHGGRRRDSSKSVMRGRTYDETTPLWRVPYHAHRDWLTFASRTSAIVNANGSDSISSIGRRKARHQFNR